MCEDCGCEDPSENCGCQGIDISCNCVKYEGERLSNSGVEAGMTVCTAFSSIEEAITTLIQDIETIVDGTVEVARGAGVPSGTPTTGGPIIYINETTGDIYTWDGTAWVLRGGITLEAIANTFVIGSPQSIITIENVSSTSKKLKVVFSNATAVIFTPASAGIDVSTASSEPRYRKRWDTHMEFDGVFKVLPTLLTYIPSPVTYPSRTITLATLPTGFQPLKIKRFPSQLRMNLTISDDPTGTYSVVFPGTIDVMTSGVVTFTVEGCGCTRTDCAVTWEAYMEIHLGKIEAANIWINHLHYYIQALA